MSRIDNHQMGFAEYDLYLDGITLSPILKTMSNFLDRDPVLAGMVRRNLESGVRHPRRGRKGLSAEPILRAAVLMFFYNLTFRELCERIAESPLLRIFTRIRYDHVPGHDAFNRAIRKITPETLRAIHERVLVIADENGIINPDKVRADCTATETNIHFPTDAALLCDSARVLGRLVQRLRREHHVAADGVVNHTRSAKSRAFEIAKMSHAKKDDEEKAKYLELLIIVEETIRDAEIVNGMALRQIERFCPKERKKVEKICECIRYFIVLAKKVVEQTDRRIINNEKVPASEKIFSIFETHTDIIMRGKSRKPVEFGHKIMITECEGGMVSDYRVLKGNPSDSGLVEGIIERHKTMFGGAPFTLACDSGFYSEENIKFCRKEGV